MVSGIGGGGLRIGGLATGMDTDEIVKKMLLGQQMKIDKVKQDKQTILWKQELYRDIIKDLKDLQNAYFSVTSKDNLNSNSNYSDYVAKVNSGTSATVTAGQGTVEGNYRIDVEQLAKGATIKSGNLGATTTLNTKLNDLSITAGSEFKISSNGKEATIKIEENDTIKTLISKIKSTKWDGKDELVGNDIDVSFSELTSTFTINTKATGSSSKLNIENVGSGNLLSGIKLTTGEQSGQGSISYVTPPGGTRTKVERDSNNFTIDGVSYNLTGVDSYDTTTGKSLTSTEVNITKDVDKTFDRIKTFFDKYNALVDKINKKITEKKDYDYKPLTDDQKKDMKEEDIKAWEEKTKKGILRNDANLEKMLSELRNTFFTSVEGSNLTFNRKELGLDTSNIASKAGQIEFTAGGEEILKKALRERPEEIMNLFNKTYTLSADDLKESKQKQKEILNKNSGVFQRINNILKDYVGLPGTTLNNAILTEYANKQDDHSIYGGIGTNKLPDQIYRKDILINQLNEKMKSKESQLYKQFAALEKAMSKYNAQASWLSQQLGGGQ
ncbi:hypothetical protein GCM10008905_18040 [Clostridium malenominatum]|uniref:Flagellar hook-associated protein 2 n=1 Tax=Clostridium malenominatum TaxID=1539 RepID=A0ABN1IYZ2_9CLOT